MNAIKKVFIGILITIIVLCTVFYSYYAIENGAIVFADDIQFMSDAELEAAYQAYLQSKGGGLIGNAGARLAYTNGKMLNFLTSDENTTPYKNINEIKGLMSWQKSELESGNSSVLQLSMSQGGASVFSLYTQWLLQNYYFGNGIEENDGMFNDGIDNMLYTGEYFTDLDGNSCLVYAYTGNEGTNTDITNFFSALGTPYKYEPNDAITVYSSNDKSYRFNICRDNNNNIKTASMNLKTGSRSLGNKLYYYIGTDATNFIPFTGDSVDYTGEKVGKGYGYPIIAKHGLDYYLCAFGVYQYNPNRTNYLVGKVSQINSNYINDDLENVDINFYTNNNNNINVYPTINEGDNLYITPKVNVGVDGEINYQPYVINEGDNITNIVNNYYTDSGTPDKTITLPSDDPAVDGGGGGSSDNPSGGNPPDWSNNFPHLTPDGDGGFNFNFTLPDLNIDWNISGLSEKFPFSIPFDLVSFCQILDAEPVTPHFDGDIVLPMLTYHFDFDFERFDELAQLVRNLEFIGFCIGLILITRSMIKG